MHSILRLILSLALPLLVGGISGYFTAAEITGWYQSINKPSWNPPGNIFGPVWTILYLMMGYAFYRIWTTKTNIELKNWAIGLFLLQLTLNFFWSFIFFKQHSPGWAFVEIIAMWLTIFCTIVIFSKLDKTAAWLLVPYISWVSFAAILNYTIWKLNHSIT
jgi:translocator protein